MEYFSPRGYKSIIYLVVHIGPNLATGMLLYIHQLDFLLNYQKNATSVGEDQVISLNEESLMAKTKLTTSIMTKIDR